MTLRRFQPIPRTGQWREQTAFRDPRTGALLDIAQATIALALYPCGGHDTYRDYGRVLPTGDRPALYAATTPDNTGILRKLPDGVSVEWAFPQSEVATLWPGSFLLILTATVADQPDEVLREPIVVLPAGPRAIGNQPGSGQQPVTVISDAREF